MINVMYCYRPKEVERCNGTMCPYEHRWDVIPETEAEDKHAENEK